MCANAVNSRTLQTSEYWKLCPHRRQAFWITTKARSCLFALRQKSRFLNVSLLWHVLTTRLSANHRTSERNNNSRLGNLSLETNDPIFSKTPEVDKSFWTATNTSTTAWVQKRILLDLRILAALVSMLARKHFLSNLHSPDSEIYCQSACSLFRQLCRWRDGSQKI